MELIDKKKAKEVTFTDTGYYDPINVATAIRDMIDALPTIEAETVKHGTWGENIYGYRKCSVCGRATQVDECMREPLYRYCPYCGAKMDEVEE